MIVSSLTSSTRPLPLIQGHGASGWLIGVAVALIINLILIVVLSLITHGELSNRPPSETTTRFTAILPPPETPMPPPTKDQEPLPVPTQNPMPVLELPQLDLPALGHGDIPVPALGTLEDQTSLPMVIPPITTWSSPASAEYQAPSVASSAFDEPPSIAETFDLERFYPQQARIRRIEGSSTIELAINESGLVSSWKVLASTPPGVFDQAIARLVPSLRFRAARRAGHAVASTLTERLVWKLAP